jgi:GR25 family glycosyltransferase involved in LPS biosynthesis
MLSNKRIIIIILLIIILVLLCLCFNKKEKYENIVPKGLNSFDKAFYINLAHRKDRKQQIENEFKRIGLNKNKIIRIDAIRNKFNGHVGAAKSHVKCIKIAKQMGLRNVIIFEDDFTFALSIEKINENINKFIEKMGNNWDVLHLCSIFINADKVEDLDIAKKVTHVTGGVGYIVNNHFYDKLQNNIQSSIDKMEEEMNELSKNNPEEKIFETEHAFDQHWQGLQKKSKWYIFDPLIGEHKDNGQSSIMGNLEAFRGNNIRFYQLKV